MNCFLCYGFAARCEATAPPRRNLRPSFRAVPLVRSLTSRLPPLIHLLGHAVEGQSPNQGHSPNRRQTHYGEAEPRLTSGGKAVPKKFSGKQELADLLAEVAQRVELALPDRYVLNITWSNVVSTWANEFVIGVLFEDVSSPTCDATDCKDRRVELERDTHHVVR